MFCTDWLIVTMHLRTQVRFYAHPNRFDSPSITCQINLDDKYSFPAKLIFHTFRTSEKSSQWLPYLGSNREIFNVTNWVHAGWKSGTKFICIRLKLWWYHRYQMWAVIIFTFTLPIQGFFLSKWFPQIFAALNLMQYNVNNKVLEKDLPSKIRVTIRLCLENNNRFYLFFYGIAIYRKRSFAETFIDLKNLLLYLNKSYITFLRNL